MPEYGAVQAVAASTHFSLSEWPDPSVLVDLDPRVITELDALRKRHGLAIHPSRHPRGFARPEPSNSRHSSFGRLADAADVFPEGHVLDCWALAQEGPWGGIGVYLDTRISPPLQPGPMLHLDLREGERVMWVRDGDYIYRNTDPARFWSLIAKTAER